jgi:hypothetical protein
MSRAGLMYSIGVIVIEDTRMRPSLLGSAAYQSYVKHIKDQLSTSGKTLEAVELSFGMPQTGVAAGPCTFCICPPCICPCLGCTACGSSAFPVEL